MKLFVIFMIKLIVDQTCSFIDKNRGSNYHLDFDPILSVLTDKHVVTGNMWIKLVTHC